jgi:hypothetical protein
VILPALAARLPAARKRSPREDAMQLTREQIESFEEQGYLFFPNCFA